MRVPLSLLLVQGPMLKTMARVAITAAIPGKRPKRNPDHFPVVAKRLPAPSRRLIRHYAAWCGAPEKRYAQTLPPHLFTQFGLPIWAVQLELTRYPLLRIINQGCGVTVNATIASGVELDVQATVAGITEKDNRARIHQQLTVGTKAGPNALSIDFYTTFILARRPGKPDPRAEKIDGAFAGTWDAAADDGYRFGILTGDLNPIHWIGPVAKRSPFGGKVMHGFGMFARSFEILQNATDETIQFIDVRFIRPVRLPDRGLEILRSAAAEQNGCRKLVLRDRRGHVLMAGSYVGARNCTG